MSSQCNPVDLVDKRALLGSVGWRSPAPPLVTEGRLNTVMSMDFNGEPDKADTRLRLAFGEFVNDNLGVGLPAGQAYSTMLDMRAVPETLGFAGPAGLWQQRHPLFRFTKAVSDTFVTEVSMETPEDVFYINAERQTRWPDFAASGFWQVAGVMAVEVGITPPSRETMALLPRFFEKGTS